MLLTPVPVGTSRTIIALDNRPVHTILVADTSIHLEKEDQPFHSKTAVKMIHVSILNLCSRSYLTSKLDTLTL